MFGFTLIAGLWLNNFGFEWSVATKQHFVNPMFGLFNGER
jgi:hypothetical protein